MTADCLDVLVC